MITEELQHRIEALNPKARKLFLLKLREALASEQKVGNDRKRIVAYVQGSDDLIIDQIKAVVQKKLPDYMVPSQFVQLQEIPLLPNGKTDRKKLDRMPLSSKKVVPAKQNINKDRTTQVETKLIAIWEEVLGFSPIHPEDNFFEIGGDSILSIQIVAKARKVGIILKPNAIFDHQTIAQLSSFAQLKEDKNGLLLEQMITTIWEEVLGFSPIHRDDNFFEIGGDSILSIQIIAKARAQGIVLQPNDLFKYQSISELVPYLTPEKTKATSAEDVLTKIWEEVLGFSPIHRDDNFFEIGGDSILSIQIIAKARKEGLIFRPNDLFENQTIGELSLFAKAESSKINTETVEGEVPLSPIQRWFFETHKNAPQYWNQAVQLDNISSVTEDQAALVCNILIKQHDVLRSRFYKRQEGWTQEIMPVEATCGLDYVTLSNAESSEINKIAHTHLQKVQDRFELCKGSLFKCIYFRNEASGRDFCMLVAHHLLVDAVSWQIIIDDFTTALREISVGKQPTLGEKTTSFKDWTNYVYSYGKEASDLERAFWKSQITSTHTLSVDKEDLHILEEKDIVQLPFTLNEQTTTALLNANQTLHTKTEELLITAFVATVGAWSESKKVSLGFERHGRETEGCDLDVSKTVGWFTTYFPVLFDYDNSATVDAQIITVKEKMRSIPNGGLGYGALLYGHTGFDKVPYPDIVFNFLGTRRDTGLSNSIKKTILTKHLRSDHSERHYKLEINLSILNGELTGIFSYSKKVHYDSTVAQLILDFKSRIQAICNYCLDTDKVRYTPSDFSEADISQDDLDSLLGSLE